MDNHGERDPVDEIEQYWNARYLSACEATWRILGFHITKKEPAVSALSVHAEDSYHHNQYQRHIQLATSSKLLHYFSRPDGSFTMDGVQRRFADLRYTEYFSLFRLQAFNGDNSNRPNFYLERPSNNGAPMMHVIQRSQDKPHLARIQHVHLSQGDVFYLRALLQHRPAVSFVDLRTVEEITHPTFQQACLALGIFAQEDEAHHCILEAITSLRTPRQIRVLFVHLLTNE